MKEGLNTLRMLFYANLLNGERDALEVIEEERENFKEMENKLIKSRERRLGNDDDHDNHDSSNSNSRDNAKPSQNERRSLAGDNTSEPATSSPARARAKRTTSSSESDEISSPYENALQIKLGLRPNEYRNGQYPFNDFVNECANETVDIRREYLNFIQQPNDVNFSFIFYPFFLTTMNKIGNCVFNLLFFLDFCRLLSPTEH